LWAVKGYGPKIKTKKFERGCGPKEKWNNSPKVKCNVTGKGLLTRG
jgi:hypothetical protein